MQSTQGDVELHAPFTPAALSQALVVFYGGNCYNRYYELWSLLSEIVTSRQTALSRVPRRRADLFRNLRAPVQSYLYGAACNATHIMITHDHEP